ncbi:DNA-binding MarR family transcriptional regulator [Cryobacterium mesophilum]|uniref:MarR family transcriptional regulator n=1 Tax=Terrimesophilobacter mesophilus TaxID=433647 RepID=A0A4V3I9M9_9MICO|nr:MarR family transcriptional regulator [Terrimesophilobacter mesophilus]MBB5633367.1 DNA-binding MarR family transcriptional regulator [Terrimesophilobacter mesophilus]TFB80098.1 MarR family transcriptional regulator [Terrimesophilobacter mesophilus]
MNDSTLAVTAWEALFRAQVSVMRRLAAEFPDGEISLGDYDVLFTLSRAPGRSLRIRELAVSTLISQPSVSRLIDRLAARSLVAKHPDPDDGRGVIVELTDAGFAAFRRAAVRHMESIDRRVGTSLTAHELAQLARLCDKLRTGGD